MGDQDRFGDEVTRVPPLTVVSEAVIRHETGITVTHEQVPDATLFDPIPVFPSGLSASGTDEPTSHQLVGPAPECGMVFGHNPAGTPAGEGE